MQVAGDYSAIDFIPEVGPIKLRIPWLPQRIEVTPGSTRLQPVETLSRDQKKTAWVVELPKLHIHTIVALEPPANAMI
jgi:hypothetical protein